MVFDNFRKNTKVKVHVEPVFDDIFQKDEKKFCRIPGELKGKFWISSDFDDTSQEVIDFFFFKKCGYWSATPILEFPPKKVQKKYKNR